MNLKLIIIMVVCAFLMGWASSSIYTYAAEVNNPQYNSVISSFNSDSQKINSESGENLEVNSVKDDKNSILTIFIQPDKADEKVSPFDRIKEEQIHVYDQRVVLDLKGAEWASFTDTNSMDPILDSGTNAIEVVPSSPNDIHVGDIVSYNSKYASGIIIHRVQKIGMDNEGWYAIMKGDNNPEQDPGKVRFDQIERVVVAIIY